MLIIACAFSVSFGLLSESLSLLPLSSFCRAPTASDMQAMAARVNPPVRRGRRHDVMQDSWFEGSSPGLLAPGRTLTSCISDNTNDDRTDDPTRDHLLQGAV